MVQELKIDTGSAIIAESSSNRNEIIDAEIVPADNNLPTLTTDNLKATIEILPQIKSLTVICSTSNIIASCEMNMQTKNDMYSKLKDDIFPEKEQHFNELFRQKYLSKVTGKTDEEIIKLQKSYSLMAKAEAESEAEENPEYKLQVESVILHLDIIIFNYSFISEPFLEKFNEKLKEAKTAIFGNWLNAKGVIDDNKNEDIFCSESTKQKKLYDKKQQILKLVKSQIMICRDKDGYIFRSNDNAQVEIGLSLSDVKDKVKATLRDDTFYEEIKVLLNPNYIIMISDHLFLAEFNIEFFVDPKTNQLIRNKYQPINCLSALNTNGTDYSLIVSFLKEYFIDINEYIVFINSLKYRLQVGESPYITNVLCGKNGVGVDFLYTMILLPLFKKNQSIRMNKESFENIDKTLDNNILCYIGGSLLSLAKDDSDIEENINNLLDRSNSLNYHLFNTSDTQFFDLESNFNSINFLTVKNDIHTFDCFQGKPKKLIAKEISSQIEAFRYYLITDTVDTESANKVYNNALKANIEKPTDGMNTFLTQIKLGNKNYIMPAKDSTDIKVRKAYDKALIGFSKSIKVGRYIPNGCLHPLFQCIEKTSIGRNNFLKKLQALDENFFCNDNKVEHQEVVYKIDSKYNDMNGMSSALVVAT